MIYMYNNYIILFLLRYFIRYCGKNGFAKFQLDTDQKSNFVELSK